MNGNKLYYELEVLKIFDKNILKFCVSWTQIQRIVTTKLSSRVKKRNTLK